MSFRRAEGGVAGKCASDAPCRVIKDLRGLDRAGQVLKLLVRYRNYVDNLCQRDTLQFLPPQSSELRADKQQRNGIYLPQR
jgi:hypothetical protein